MKPTIEILIRLQENSKNNHDEVFTKLFRYLLRPDIYYVAFQNLYANNGAGTRGVDDDTADGFSEDKVNQIIEVLENGTYEPKPVRRTYSRLKAYRCELCGYEGKDRKYEVHHVNKVKNLKGKEPWEVVMIAKHRKTLVVCHDCHQKIHHGF